MQSGYFICLRSRRHTESEEHSTASWGEIPAYLRQYRGARPRVLLLNNFPPDTLLFGARFNHAVKFLAVVHLFISNPISLIIPIALVSVIPNIFVKSVPVI